MYARKIQVYYRHQNLIKITLDKIFVTQFVEKRDALL